MQLPNCIFSSLPSGGTRNVGAFPIIVIPQGKPGILLIRLTNITRFMKATKTKIEKIAITENKVTLLGVVIHPIAK